ncbi:hypothetical protein KFU94_55555 [Chloroflexi bacterium TSY]|nr:hypothetical protein [Chloroflexi bacterium TSY]MBV7331294.1 hypothetical protein [Chloroflexi bacterium TSY]MBV7335728.1 hypothetical protein [Chloroflexi bacterium TSY]MBV7337303.1 hypothetical protein [Chloroflexi bacterium TSY]
MEREWEAKKLEGYRVKSIDITGFWRPKLQGKVNRLYNSTARRALPAHLWSDDKLGGDRRETSATAQGNHEMRGRHKGK